MSYVGEIKNIATQILDKLNELDMPKEVIVITENSTGRLEKTICPNCSEEVGINDDLCACGQKLIRY